MTPAIWAACKVYSSDALFMLARLGADLERPDMTHRNTPLHWYYFSNFILGVFYLFFIKFMFYLGQLFIGTMQLSLRCVRTGDGDYRL